MGLKGIKYLRKKSRLKLREVAAATGVCLRTVQAWEEQKATPNTERLRKLQMLFGSTMDALINGKEENGMD